MSRPTPEWLDEQYNNRVRIPEHPQIFERWGRASALAREESACRLDIAYGNGAGAGYSDSDSDSEMLDIFPAPTSGAPVLVFIHGGYWRSLDKRDLSFVAPPFVNAGAMVVVPNYALCPAVTIEHITMQMVRALVWVHHHAATYGGDPRRIVVAGHSAGGHLAAMLLCCDWKQVSDELPRHLVRSALSISGLFDLEPLRHAPFIAGDLRLSEASARRLSPAHMPAPAGCLYALVGGNESDEFLRQNAMIRARWGQRAVPICETVPGTNHLDVLHELVDAESRLHHLVLQCLGLRFTTLKERASK